VHSDIVAHSACSLPLAFGEAVDLRLECFVGGLEHSAGYKHLLLRKSMGPG
jgi:hypothetical protein